MFDADKLSIAARGIVLEGIVPLIDGAVPDHGPPVATSNSVEWAIDGGYFVLTIDPGDALRLTCQIKGIDRLLDSIGLRFERVTGVRRYLRNGYQSWDGSFFVDAGTPPGDGPPGKAPTLGFAMTTLLPDGDGALVLGFTRHDRFQTRYRFGGTAGAMTIDAETLLDRTDTREGEAMVLFECEDVEEGLRHWSQIVARESPLPPRLPEHRITGWCSWYNHYAMIDEATIRAELASCHAFRDMHEVPLDVFQIDDGFTPEMGDWLEIKPGFPSGMKPLLADIAAAGFKPGLWIAPFMVGSRSKLYAAHPDWVVQDVKSGPLVQMKFYGEFRWHKRSEEYYILDVTHPDAATYIADVFRTWRHDWGARYFKTDFMLFGSEHGPDRAVWHEQGLSRIAIWRRMATLIRENIGDALWLGCGCPLWASVGYVDAVRIGRDIGVSWEGEYSAESLLRDLATRNHAHGVLWQADPDCVLLRDRFHDLNDTQIESLARFAGASGGVLMTSDTLSALPPSRAALFAELLASQTRGSRFPALGVDGPVRYDSNGQQFVFNTCAETIEYAGHIVRPFETATV
jgi:alpha-galactosidase